MDIKCPRCGTFNSQGARFCNQCGEALLTRSVPADSPRRSDGRPTSLPESLSQTNASADASRAPSDGWRPVGKSSADTSPGLAQGAPPAAPFIRPPIGTEGATPSSLPEPPGSGALGQARAVSRAVGRVAHAAAGNKVIGEARQIRVDVISNQNATVKIMTFRVDRYDSAGNRLSPVPVEMRAESFQNAIGEGDWVEIPGGWHEGVLMRPKRIYNLTTHTSFTAKTSPLGTAYRGIGQFFNWVITLFFVGLVLLVIFAVLSSLGR